MPIEDENIVAEEDKKDGEKKKKGGKIASLFIGLIIVCIWLLVLAALIKFDVGGFGSSVMYPIFKDVPVINKILPDVVDESDVEGYPYKSLADAIKYIKDLEKEIQNNNETVKSQREEIADLKAENSRLSEFETKMKEFDDMKNEYYQEVVFGENAIEYENYKKYYEEIDPENAEKLYKQVLAEYFKDEQYQSLADAYSAMKPKKAAASIYEMTGDLDKVVEILNCMTTENRAAILDALSDIDPVFCAKITVMLTP